MALNLHRVMVKQKGGSMKKILIADDDPNIRLIFQTTLQRSGYNVITASSGIQALELLLHEEPDLIILDIKMPDVHGIEVLGLIRESENNIPVIMCSAFEGMKEDFVIKSSNIFEYLVKPVDLKILNAVVKRALAAVYA
ncbi:MAG: response regulator [Candidatus Cloacimonadota bacterium]|nr:MAG: response regulator [Candidatus Cloacimonadota bacterium]